MPAPARCSLTRHCTARAYAWADTLSGGACAPAHARAFATGSASSAPTARHSRARPLPGTDTTPFVTPTGLAVGLARKGRATPGSAGDSPLARVGLWVPRLPPVRAGRSSAGHNDGPHSTRASRRNDFAQFVMHLRLLCAE